MATLLRSDTAPQRIDTTPQPMPALSAKPIEGSRYWSREFMDREWEGIWTKSWLIGGLAAQVAKPGDFFTYDIGRESILVTHGDDGQIRAFYNVCPHRGHQLLSGEGKAKNVITCPYHAWAFKLDGNLAHARNCENVANFDSEKAQLTPVRLEEYAGFVFINMDPNAGSVEE